METVQIDGNKVDEVYQAIQEIKEKQEVKPEPFLVEAISFRMRGHEEASGTKYYPEVARAMESKGPHCPF